MILGLVGTFLVVRGFLLFSPETDLHIGEHNVHHLFVGLILILAFQPLLARAEGNLWRLRLSALGYGAGLSLALDEWAYLIATDGSNASYWLPVSYWGGLLMISVATFYLIGMDLAAALQARAETSGVPE